MKKAKNGDPAAFLARIVAEPECEACIEWPFSKNSKGYGKLWVDGSLVAASRYSLVLFTGGDRPGLLACHGPCHNPGCVNPYHLSWGTHADNVRDKRRDGTDHGGERHPQARLTRADVEEIQRRCARGELQREVAKEFGVSRGHVSGIVTGRFWRVTT